MEENQLEKLPKKYNQTEKGIVIPNDNTDLYCYNMMILEFIAKEKIYRLKEEELRKEIVAERGKDFEIEFNKKLNEVIAAIMNV